MSDDVRFIEFYGDRFALPARFNARLLTKFLRAASEEVDSESVEGMILVDRMLDGCVREEDRKRFDAVCDRECPDFEDLMAFMMEAVSLISDRPIGRPSVSSAGSRTTSGNSAGDSSSQVINQLEEQGRPDLALQVARVQERRAQLSSVSA